MTLETLALAAYIAHRHFEGTGEKLRISSFGGRWKVVSKAL
jgi:hypothetical protein